MSIDNFDFDRIIEDETRNELAIARLVLEKRDKIDESTLMMELLAQTQFATAGQLCRVADNINPMSVCSYINLLLDAKLIGKIPNVTILRGRHKSRKTTVYFLTKLGRKSLKNYFGKTAQYAKPGLPDRITHSRINHQLLVAEAYLYVDNNSYILKCENEDLLKAERQALNKNCGRAEKRQSRVGAAYRICASLY